MHYDEIFAIFAEDLKLYRNSIYFIHPKYISHGKFDKI